MESKNYSQFNKLLLISLLMEENSLLSKSNCRLKGIFVRSRTGTGKTLAFLLPLEELLLREEEEGEDLDKVKAVILEPTRELAIQVKTQIDKFSNLSAVLVYGGDAQKAYQNSKFVVL